MEKSARRSKELSAGGWMPVCAPTPAVPLAMPGLSSCSKAGASGFICSAAALERVGRAGSFGFFGLGGFGITAIWGGIYGNGRTEQTDVVIAREGGSSIRVSPLSCRQWRRFGEATGT